MTKAGERMLTGFFYARVNRALPRLGYRNPGALNNHHIDVSTFQQANHFLADAVIGDQDINIANR